MLWAEKGFFVLGLLLGAILLLRSGAKAEGLPPSSFLMGPAGLNAIPTARMPPPGTLHVGLAIEAPYEHIAASLQLAPPLSLTLRRSRETHGLQPGIETNARRTWQALDFKLRLMQETARLPELAIGVNAAVGQKQTAAEYLVASKRLDDFEFTAGLGWGRMGEGGELRNPLRRLRSRSGRDRAAESAEPSGPGSWLSGDSIGLFGGIEYFPPFLRNMSVKLDWRPDRWRLEERRLDFDAPAPWAAGLQWRALPWLDLGLALSGGKSVMARAALRQDAARWHTGWIRPTQAEVPAPAAKGTVSLDLVPGLSGPAQMGQALRAMAVRDREATLALAPAVYGLKGPLLRLPRSGIEKAFAKGGGSSAEELWRDAAFSPAPVREDSRPAATSWKPHLRLDLKVDPAPRDSEVVHRTALLASLRQTLWKAKGILWGTTARIGLTDTLPQAQAGSGPSVRGDSLSLPGREGAEAYESTRAGFEDLFIGWSGSPAPDLHAMLVGGYIDDLHAGGGGEILWRPFGKTLALGAEGWVARRRDPASALAVGLLPGTGASGFLKAWYEVPQTPLTAHLKAGRYLAGDIGATLGLDARLGNGVKFESFVTVTNDRDRDAWGVRLPVSAGLRITVPISHPALNAVTQSADGRIGIEPMTRRSGAAIQTPLPLYELTDTLSYRRLAQDWGDLLR